MWLTFSVVDLRTSLIYKSTPKFTMKAPCIAVQWRVAITLVRPSQRWATTSRERTRLGGFGCPPAWTTSHFSIICAIHSVLSWSQTLTIFQVGGAPKYKCHICDKVFSWCYTLTLHLRKKHELKWPSGHSRFRFVAVECRPWHRNWLCI